MAGSDPYSKTVMDHFMNPRNMGELEDADAVGEEGSLICGDIPRVYLKIEGDVITDIRFKTFGCGAAIASSSMMTEMLKGRTIKQALALTNQQVVDALEGLPEVKIHCSVLAEDALYTALKNYYEKNGLDIQQLETMKAVVRGL